MATKKPIKKIVKSTAEPSTPLSEREAPPQFSIVPADIILPVMNQAQVNIVLQRTPEYAIKVRQGPGGKLFRYVKQGYVVSQLNKAFGMDWDIELLPINGNALYDCEVERRTMPAKRKGDPDVVVETRYMTVAGKLTVRVHNPKTGEIIATISKTGFGSQIWNANTEKGDALKGARSDCLKNCTYQLGIALDLYWDDSAELEEYNKRVEASNKAGEVEGIATEIGVTYPSNVGQLIAMAANTFQYDLPKVTEVLQAPFSDIVLAFTQGNPEEIGKQYWERLMAHYDKQSVGESAG